MPLPSFAHVRGSIDWAAWRPRRSAMLWMAAAFLAGLALFAWRVPTPPSQPDRAEAGSTSALPQYSPLPIPMPADATRRSAPAPVDPEKVATLEPAAPPAVNKPAPPSVRAAPRPSKPAAASATSAPRPSSTPAPRYPARALRNGESGTVMVRAEIGADGVPTSVSVERGSGSRDLDRAGVDAVRRWRFEPAMRDGRPTSGSVVVPIDFRQ